MYFVEDFQATKYLSVLNYLLLKPFQKTIIQNLKKENYYNLWPFNYIYKLVLTHLK